MRKQQIMRIRRTVAVIGTFCLIVLEATACRRAPSASNNDRMTITTESESERETAKSVTGESLEQDTDATEHSTEAEPPNKNAIIKENSIYDCDMEADRAAYDGVVDITVGDDYYAAQINDWYMYFPQYEGKVVEIEGYYIGDFAPYDFIGRYGPSCPYCTGGYVSFEILTDEDVSQLVSVQDWIKVTGILREGIDSMKGPFYYIEALQLEKMPEVGVATVSN